MSYPLVVPSGRQAVPVNALPYSPHKLCELLVMTDDGRPWRLTSMPFFKEIYDKPRQKLLLLTSRQSTKSTYLRNISFIRSITRPGNSALYVAPTETQVGDFSNKKFDRIFDYNPHLRAHVAGDTWNVGLKEFRVRGGMSTLTLRSTGGALGAARIRGNTANDIFLDEYQDLHEDDIPVIEECAATFDGRDGRPNALYVYTGTPLSNQNILQKQFNASRKCEWHIQCPHCSTGTGRFRSILEDPLEREVRRGGWNDPIGMHHIDPSRAYLFCQYCGKNMNVPTLFSTSTCIPPWGTWISHNPEGRFDGYRVVRMMMPWARWRTENDDGILDRQESWPEHRFANEVMGLPFDAGTQPITEKQIRALCDDYPLPLTDYDASLVAEQHRGYLKFAGLDWAMQASGDSTASYTIIGVFALVNDRLKLIYAERFVGLNSNDPAHVLRRIFWVMDTFEVKRLGADYGVGYKEVLRLISQYGSERVACFQYKASQENSSTTYDANANKWIIPKTRTLDQLCVDIGAGRFVLPRYEDVSTYTNDWLSLTVDVNPSTRGIRYGKLGPEDFVHVANYANLAKRIEFQEDGFKSHIPQPPIEISHERAFYGTDRHEEGFCGMSMDW